MFVGQAVGTITSLSDFSTGKVCGHALYQHDLVLGTLNFLPLLIPQWKAQLVSLMSVAQTTFPLGLILTHSSDSVFALQLEVFFMPGLGEWSCDACLGFARWAPLKCNLSIELPGHPPSRVLPRITPCYCSSPIQRKRIVWHMHARIPVCLHCKSVSDVSSVPDDFSLAFFPLFFTHSFLSLLQTCTPTSVIYLIS